MQHLGTIVARHAKYRPDSTAVVFGEQRLTWREFHSRVNRAANVLASLALRKGDAVALIVPNCLELLELYWAGAATGIVIVPLSPLLRASGLLSLIQDSGAKAVIAAPELAELLDEVRPSLLAVRREIGRASCRERV